MRFKLPILFSARLGQIERVVFGIHSHRLLAGSIERARDVGRKRRMAAFMFGNQRTKNPDARLIINRTEMQEYALPFRLDIETTNKPASEMKTAVAYSACLGFRRKRNKDLVAPIN